MIDGVNNNLNLGNIAAAGKLSAAKFALPAVAGNGPSFAEVLKNNINQVARLRQDASSSVETLVAGKTQDMSNVMTAVEKADLAFNLLMAIRAKLMDAYEEIKNISI